MADLDTAKRPVRRAAALGLLAAVTGVALTACAEPASGPSVANLGAASSSAPTSAAGADSATDPRLAFAQCMRGQGITDFKDPSGDGGGFQVPNNPDPTFQAALKACQSKLTGGGGTNSPEAQKAQNEFVAKQLKFAACIRENGIPDFPDPNTEGTINWNTGSFQSPEFQQANEKCKQFSSFDENTMPVPQGTP